MSAYTLVYPMDLVKTLLSLNIIQPRKSLIASILEVYRTYGFRALYQGLSATLYVRSTGVDAVLSSQIHCLRAP